MNTRKSNLISNVAMALGVTLLLAPHTWAEDDMKKINAADIRFIQQEAATGTAMANMAELGQRNAQREDVKSFATTLAADHATANAELKTLASLKGVDLTSESAAKHGDRQTKLETTSSKDFDKAFLAMVISGHEKCVRKFESASTDAQDGDVKAWATKMLPGLQAHLKTARELDSVSTVKDGVTSTENQAGQPDNTVRNRRDRNMDTLTPLDQGNSKPDIDTTAQIRREIIDLKGVSVNAKNVKIITNEGHVTLRGPVDSADEKRMIGEIATRIATAEHTDNQLEVRGAGAAY